jgi:hypothetical protein
LSSSEQRKRSEKNSLLLSVRLQNELRPRRLLGALKAVVLVDKEKVAVLVLRLVVLVLLVQVVVVRRPPVADKIVHLLVAKVTLTRSFLWICLVRVSLPGTMIVVAHGQLKKSGVPLVVNVAVIPDAVQVSLQFHKRSMMRWRKREHAV